MTIEMSELNLPSSWLPIGDNPATLRAGLPLPVPDHAWVRWHADEARGGVPYLICEAFWIMGGMMHVARFDQFVVPDAGVETDDEPAGLLAHERISVERIEKVEMSLTEEAGVVHITGQGERRDLPAFLVMSHIKAGSEGYAAGL